MQPREALDALRKRWLWVVLFVIIGTGAAAALSLSATPTYTSSASVYFSLSYGDSASALSQGSSYTQGQVQSFAEVAELPIVLDPVISKLSLSTDSAALAGRVSATASSDTVIVDIAVVDTSPVRAAAIADAVAEQLGIQVGALSPKAANGSPAVNATTISPARVPVSPSAPKSDLNILVGIFASLLFGIITVLLRQLLDTKVRTSADLLRITSAPLIGEIAVDDAGGKRGLFLTDRPLSQQAEAFRRMRTNLNFLSVDDQPLTAVITSSLSGEGKSTTAINLGIALADTGAKVLLIDADLRRPSIAGYLGLEGAAGLTTILIGRAQLVDVVQPWGIGNLDILAAGEQPPNPSELLGSRAMHDLLGQVRDVYDFILIDTPPLLPVADAVVLSRMVSGVIVLASHGRVQKAQFAESVAGLAKVNSRVLGVVLTRVPLNTDDDSYYLYTPTDISLQSSPPAAVPKGGSARGLNPSKFAAGHETTKETPSSPPVVGKPAAAGLRKG